MKRSRIIIAILLVAMLFSSCNADLVQNKKGIFESMMTSAPNTDYTIQKFSGKLNDGQYIIETNNGIEKLSTDGTKSGFISGLKATLKFIQGDNVFFSIEETGRKDSNFLYAPIPADNSVIDKGTALALKVVETPVTIQASFYEHGKYVLLLVDADKNFYIANDAAKGTLDAEAKTFVFKEADAAKTVKPEKDAKKENITIDSPVYVGSGYYYVGYGSDYFLYNSLNDEEVKIDGKTLTVKPFAVENNTLFVSATENNIYTISGNTATVVTGDKNKHSITYIHPNQDIPMDTNTETNTIYGCYGSKPFSFSGSTFTEGEVIGSGVVIIDVIYDKESRTYYAFSAENGLYSSTDGMSYNRISK